MAVMDMNPDITAAVFAAYLRCSTKSYLTAHGEKPPDTFVAETCGRISLAYKTRANQRFRTGLTGVVPIDFVRLANQPDRKATTLFVDCETAFYACDQATSAGRGLQINRSELRRAFVPILYSAWDKSDQSDELLVCFGALAIGQATGSRIPTSGKVVYGENHRIRIVRIADHLPKTRQVIEAIASFCLAPGHRGDRFVLPRCGTTPAHTQQALLSMRFPIAVPRPRGLTRRPQLTWSN